MADRALARYGEGSWAALELDDYGLINPDEPDRGTFAAYNQGIFDDFLYHWRLRGMKAGGWVTEGGNLFMVPSHADLAIAEIEGPGDLEGVTNVINGVGAGPLPTCSLATVTNFSTLTRENCKPLIDAGMTCLAECYMNVQPNQTPDNMNNIAKWLGWPTSQPVFGVYPVNGVPPPSYAQWRDWPGVDYLGEYVL